MYFLFINFGKKKLLETKFKIYEMIETTIWTKIEQTLKYENQNNILTEYEISPALFKYLLNILLNLSSSISLSFWVCSSLNIVVSSSFNINFHLLGLFSSSPQMRKSVKYYIKFVLINRLKLLGWINDLKIFVPDFHIKYQYEWKQHI